MFDFDQPLVIAGLLLGLAAPPGDQSSRTSGERHFRRQPWDVENLDRTKSGPRRDSTGR
jgi:hypothetical protein